MSNDINVTQSSVVAIQGTPVNSVAPTDGYALIYDAVDGYWKPAPLSVNGSMYIYTNPTYIDTSITTGYSLINTGYIAGQSNGTILSTSNGSITVNKSSTIMLQFTTTWGTENAAGNLYYQMVFFKNGSIIANSVQQVFATGPFGSAPQCSNIQFMTTASAGDYFDVRIEPIGATTRSLNQFPVIFIASFSLWSV